jgi:phosphoglycolate phosphatase
MTLVVLDLDGTLVDSAADLALAINAALSAVSLPEASDARVRSWIGDGVDVLVERAIDGQGGDVTALFPVARKVFGATYERHLFDRSRLYDGVPDTLDALKSAGFALACVTNKKESYALSILEQAGILDRFALVIGGDTLPRRWCMPPRPCGRWRAQRSWWGIHIMI